MSAFFLFTFQKSKNVFAKVKLQRFAFLLFFETNKSESASFTFCIFTFFQKQKCKKQKCKFLLFQFSFFDTASWKRIAAASFWILNRVCLLFDLKNTHIARIKHTHTRTHTKLLAQPKLFFKKSKVGTFTKKNFEKGKTAAILLFTFGFALLLFEKVKLQKAKPPVAFLGFRSG